MTKCEIDVREAIVIIDCLTNDARGSKRKNALSPEELIYQVDMLREVTLGAKVTVFCQIKPMKHVNVVPHNELLHEYLCRVGEYGCQTMICMDYLRWDGYHVLPQYKSVLHRQYACALLGIAVPCPTPLENFRSGHVMRQFDQEWPELGTRRVEGPSSRHGWRW